MKKFYMGNLYKLKDNKKYKLKKKRKINKTHIKQ